MSDTQVTRGGTDRILTGQSNWIRWYLSFKADARADDTWSLFDGSETIIIKPQRADYLQYAAAANAATAAATNADATVNDTASQASTSTTAALVLGNKATKPKVARHDFLYKQSFDSYRIDLHDYEKQHERIRRANKMLYDRIDPSMQAEIEDMQVPATALSHLQTQYRMQDSRAIQLAHDKIDSLTLGNCKDMTEYVNKMRQLKNDLVYLGDPLTDIRFIAKLIKGLPATYDSWVECYHDIVADPEVTNPSLRSIKAQLISKEATRPKSNASRPLLHIMADKQVTQDDGRKKLRDQDDFIRWYTTFRSASKTQDTWSLFNGSEAILDKPDRLLFIAQTTPLPGSDDTASIARRDSDYELALDTYREDRDEYDKQRKRVNKAIAHLHESVDEVFHQQLQDFYKSPAKALAYLRANYSKPSGAAISMIYDEMDNIKLDSSASMVDYLNKLALARADLEEARQKIGLTDAHKPWLTNYWIQDGDSRWMTLRMVTNALVDTEKRLPPPAKPKAKAGRGRGKAKDKNIESEVAAR